MYFALIIRHAKCILTMFHSVESSKYLGNIIPLCKINRYQSKHFLENNNERTYGVRVLCFGVLDC